MVAHEKELQIRVCEELQQYAGYQWTPPADLAAVKLQGGNMPGTDAKLFDKQRGLYPPDIFAYLQTTQGSEYKKLFPATLTLEEAAKRREALLTEIAKRMDRPFGKQGGLLAMLTTEFVVTIGDKTCKFWLGQLPPDATDNPNAMARFKGNILRVIHEVVYSQHKDDAIDLVITLNGLPVATLELKSGGTQTAQHAIIQYREDRTPEAVDRAGRKQGRQREPLLAGHRALVHFAADQYQVWMTTELQGKTTHFLPFTPDPLVDAEDFDPDVVQTDYLWHDILTSHSLLAILKNFVIQTTVEDKNPQTGKKTYREDTRFPRYHQWFGISTAIATTLREGPGKSALMMWSAGSGKSDGIAWLAHALATLHYDDPSYQLDVLSPRLCTAVLDAAPTQLHTRTRGKVFTGGGFVITDRLNLDKQISDTVRRKQVASGFIAQIGKVVGAVSRSKRGQLEEELLKAGSGIKILTLQTFPHALESMRALATSGRLGEDQTYFVIRDEAHTAEGGKSANSMQALLNFSALAREAVAQQGLELAQLDDATLVDAIMAARQTARADTGRISYFAFTATPKTKTLERFGRLDEDGQRHVFHAYTMDEAIKEKYILDVLTNYTTYDVAATLVASTEAGQRLVESHEAEHEIQAWLRHHPDTLQAKAEIIIEHFFATGLNSLKQNAAQGMVFADSREAALTYKRELDNVIRRKGLNLHTLVAFSGELTDPTTGEIINEISANLGITGKDIAQVFSKGVSPTQPYHLLIVADKYQTGYDNPRLVAGYIDKKVQDAAAVQLLSRFNRTAHALDKREVYILDFANEYQDIRNAFGRYHDRLTLTDKTNPNVLHELQNQIEAYGYYTMDLVTDYHAARLKRQNIRADNLLNRAREPWQADMKRADSMDDASRFAELQALPGLLHRYVTAYGYQTTLMTYNDPTMEKLADFYSGLYTTLNARNTDSDREKTNFDLDGIGIVTTRIRKQTNPISPYAPLTPLTITDPVAKHTGTHETHDLVYLQELINYLNQLVSGDSQVKDTDANTLIEGIVNTAQQNPKFMERVRSNDLQRLLSSGDTKHDIELMLSDNYEAHTILLSRILGDPQETDEVNKRILSLIWLRSQEKTNKL